MTFTQENDFYTDEYEYYEELFDPLAGGGRGTRGVGHRVRAEVPYALVDLDLAVRADHEEAVVAA